MTDRRANIVQHFAYMPFGELLVDNYTVDLDYRFSAKETDRESGLSYFGARYYDNTSAMWLGIDPLWEKNIGASPYNYCHGNPINMVDPDGRDEVSIEYKENKWRITKVNLDGSGDDKFFVHIDGKPGVGVVRFSEGDSEKRINCLNLYVGDTKASFTLGVYHISGRNEEGATGFYVTPGGDASLMIGSGRRIPEGSYPLDGPGTAWKQPGAGGPAADRGVKFHFGKGNARAWTEGCFVISPDYNIKNNKVIFDSERSPNHLTSFDKALDATRIYDYDYKNRCRIGTELPSQSYNRTVNVKTVKSIWQRK